MMSWWVDARCTRCTHFYWQCQRKLIRSWSAQTIDEFIDCLILDLDFYGLKYTRSERSRTRRLEKKEHNLWLVCHCLWPNWRFKCLPVACVSPTLLYLTDLLWLHCQNISFDLLYWCSTLASLIQLRIASILKGLKRYAQYSDRYL